jgi:hypothetical protein
MPNVIPTKTPHEVPPVKDHRPLDHPVVPPDDPNADRQDREGDIDPPPTDPPLRAPSENPGVVEPPARACVAASSICRDDRRAPAARAARADRPRATHTRSTLAICVLAQPLLGHPAAAYELLN